MCLARAGLPKLTASSINVRVSTLSLPTPNVPVHPSHVEQVDRQALHAADGSRDDVHLPLTLVLLRGDREHRCGTENGLQRVAEVVREDRQDLIAKLRRALRVRARIALAIQEGFAFLLDGFLGRQVDDKLDALAFVQSGCRE